MATAITTRPPSNPPKMKPPPPPPLHTAITPSTSGYAQSAGSKRPPSLTSATSAGPSGPTLNGGPPKAAPRRKDSQRPPQAGITNKSGAGDGKAGVRRPAKELKEPYGITNCGSPQGCRLMYG